jgi:hypothetical protein
MLMLIWLTVVVVFFSVPRSKLVGYVLPAVPPLAYLMAVAWVDRPRARRLWYACAATGAVVSLGVVLFLSLHPMRNSHELAQQLSARRLPNEPVFLLARYDYDLPFYARLRASLAVVDDWSNPRLRTSDNWRKELLDSGDFRPEAARQRLIAREQLSALLCDAPTSWIIGSPGDARAYPFLVAANLTWSGQGVSLWRVRRDELQEDGASACAGVDGHARTARR